MVLEKTLESHLDCKEIKPVNLKGNQPWIFTGRTAAETPILWPPDMKSWLIGKDPNLLGKTEGRRRRRQRMRWLDGIRELMDMSLNKFWEIMKNREACYAAVHGVPKTWTWFSDWMTTSCFMAKILHASAMFLIANIWKQPKYSLTGEW